MKKIAMYYSASLIHARETGGIRRFKELVRELPQYCSLTLLSADDGYEIKKCFDSVNHVGKSHKNSSNKEIINMLKNLRWLKAARENDFDKIIVFEAPSCLALWLCGYKHIVLLIRKNLIQVERIRQREHFVPAKYVFALMCKHLIEGWALLISEKTIVQCSNDFEELRKRHIFLTSIIAKKTIIQVNNANPSWIKKSDSEYKNNPVFTVGTVNDFRGVLKGCDIFLEACASLLDDGIKIIAIIAGDGKLYEEYKQKYSNYESIIFVGRIADSISFMRKCDLIVVPSRTDSCPNTVIEAMNAQVPVIGSNCGGIPDILPMSALFNPNPLDLSNMIKKYMKSDCRKELLQLENQYKERLTFDWVKRIFEIAIT